MADQELVFVPAPEVGHLVSTLKFAKPILDRHAKLSITVLCMSFGYAPEASAYTRSLVGSHSRINLLDLPPPNPPQVDPRKSIEHFIYVSVESMVPHVKNALTSIASRSRVVALVLDFFCLPFLDVASDLNIDSYMFMTSNLAFIGLMLYLPGRHDRAGSEFEESDNMSTLPGFSNPVPASVLPSAVYDKEGGYDCFVKLARRFRDVKGIIVNTFAELEDYSFKWFSREEKALSIYPVGPVIDVEGRAYPSLEKARRDEIMSWLDEQPQGSVVFLCFGSAGSFGASQLREIARGLERSERRFVWSVRASEADKRLDEVLPEGFLERVRGRGLVCDGWAPQAEVLGHEAVGGFVSHCGWNSILESLWHGVPIAAWPMYAEQQLNAFLMVRELGLVSVVVRMDYRQGAEDVVPSDEIAVAVRILMDGESGVRERVKEMSEMARRALVTGGSSFSAVDRLVNDIMGSKS